MTYSEFVASRFKSASHTAMDLKLIDGTIAQMLHAAIGMSGELVEIELADSRKNLVEELGDFWFYFRATSDLPAATVPDYIKVSQSEGMMLLKRATNDILDAAKKLAIYRKPLTPELENRLRTAVQDISLNFPILVKYFGLTMEEVEAENVFKLTKRYPDGYSNQAAQDRADKGGE